MQIKHNFAGNKALQSGEIQSAIDFFKKSQNLFGQAYCCFLTGDFEEAKCFLKPIKESSSAANWLLSLISIAEGKEIIAPTYFQIRNFYEQDLEMLLLYKQKDTVRKILDNNQYFEKYNKEIYKYSARVLFNNKMYDTAEKLLKKSLEILYKDPETHYMLGEIYEIKKEYTEAKKEYNKSNEVTGEYLPAKNKLEKLNKWIV